MSGNGGEAEEGWDGRNRSFLAGRHRDFADRYARLGLEFVWFYNVTNHPEHNGPLRGSTDLSILTEPLACRLSFSMFLGVDWEGEDRSTWHRWFGPILGDVPSHTQEEAQIERRLHFLLTFLHMAWSCIHFGVGNFLSQTLHASLGVAEKTPLPCVAVCGVGLEDPWLSLWRIDREKYIIYVIFVVYRLSWLIGHVFCVLL